MTIPFEAFHHPRDTDGRFAAKRNSAPAGALAATPNSLDARVAELEADERSLFEAMAEARSAHAAVKAELIRARMRRDYPDVKAVWLCQDWENGAWQIGHLVTADGQREVGNERTHPNFPGSLGRLETLAADESRWESMFESPLFELDDEDHDGYNGATFHIDER